MLVIVCMSLAIQEIILTSQIIEWYLPRLFIESIKFYKMIGSKRDEVFLFEKIGCNQTENE